MRARKVKNKKNKKIENKTNNRSPNNSKTYIIMFEGKNSIGFYLNFCDHFLYL